MVRLLLILAAAAVILEVNHAKPLDQATVAIAIVAILAFIWSRLSVRRLTLVREPLVDHVAVGEMFDERLTLMNTSMLPKPWLEVLDYSTLPGHAAGQVVRVRSRGSVRWRARSICRQRGEYELGPVRVRSGDPFGLFNRTVIAPETIKVVVWPVAVSLPGFAEPGGVFSGGPQTGWSPFTSPSISGIREYAPGDPFNRIAWTATARSNTLMVKEFEQDPIADVWLLLDLQRDAQVGNHERLPQIFESQPERFLGNTTEYGIAVAASICRTYLERGRSVGLMLTTLRPVVLSPDRGDAHFARIMDILAVAQADGMSPVAEVILGHEGRFSRQTSLVVVSCSPDEGWSAEVARLNGLGIATQAVVIQPETFGAAQSSLPLVGSLIASGVPVATVAFGDRLETISNADARMGGVYAAG